MSCQIMICHSVMLLDGIHVELNPISLSLQVLSGGLSSHVLSGEALGQDVIGHFFCKSV